MLTGMAALSATAVAGSIALPASAAAAVTGSQGSALPISPVRVPQTDLGLTQQSDAKIQWMRDSRLGMFIHWGVYAGPAQGEWYEHNAAIPPETYKNFVTVASPQQFTADAYRPADWAQLAKDFGAGYTVLTTRHHDGFALWPATHPNAWTCGQAPLSTDFVAAYVSAVRAAGLRVGLYYSPIDWRYPGYYDVTGTNCAANPWGYVTDPAHHENARIMKNEVYQSVKELVTQYGAIDDLWWDGGWLAEQGTDADAAYFWEPGRYRDPANGWLVDAPYGATESGTGKPLGLSGLVRQYQPNASVTSRSGWIGDYGVEEGGNVPTGPIRTGDLVQKAFTVGGSWGISNTPAMSFSSAMAVLANTFVRDMVALVNVGPDRHGAVPADQAALLRRLGGFMTANSEAVYNTRGGPWNPVDGQYGFTYKANTVYVHLFPGYTGTSFTTPLLGDAKAVRVYDVVSKNTLAFTTGPDGSVTVTGIDRTRYPDDTVIAVVLDRAVAPGDIAQGKTATADSVETSHGNLAANAVDGDTATRWCAADGATGHWLKVDLGSVRTLTGTRIVWEFDNTSYRYRIEGSADNAAWTTVADLTTTTDTGQVQTAAFTTRARYVRVTVTGLPAGAWASIRNLEVYDRPFTTSLDMTVGSVLGNGGFETGSLSPWYAWNSASVVTGAARTGTYALRVGPGPASAEQTITVQPNTTYRVDGWARVATSGDQAYLGVKNYGGTETSVAITSTSYAAASVQFSTGSATTQATVYCYKATGGGNAYFDDVTVTPI
ncbi:alpha-L-fucosidase [Catenulispora rubra]|uniref:alpha-L-fucosidase n=1 Tax=Catenulispora rubra TaxID=280293 RepID=UPI0018922F74|nr:alpha-L-fucosidase [Catenulispora rubra]